MILASHDIKTGAIIAEASICLFLGCVRHPQKNGYCIGHAIYSDIPKERPAPKPIPKRSEKMKGVMKELSKLYPAYLKANPVCNIQSPECTIKATCINHTRGRGHNQVLNQMTWEPSCTACNGWIERNHAIAEVAGHKKSRHKK